MQNLNCTCRHAWNVQAQNINEVNNKIVLTINVLSGLGMSSAADNVIASESDITHSCAFLLLSLGIPLVMINYKVNFPSVWSETRR